MCSNCAKVLCWMPGLESTFSALEFFHHNTKNWHDNKIWASFKSFEICTSPVEDFVKSFKEETYKDFQILPLLLWILLLWIFFLLHTLPFLCCSGSDPPPPDPPPLEQVNIRLLHFYLWQVCSDLLVQYLLHNLTYARCRLNKMCVDVLVSCCHEVECRVHVNWQVLLGDKGCTWGTLTGIVHSE